MSSKFGKRMSSILVRRKDSTRPASPSPLGTSPPKTREASVDESAPSIPQSDSPPSGSPILAPTQGSGRPASLKSTRSIRSIRSIFGKKTRAPAPVANEVVAEPEPMPMASEALTAEPESVDEVADKVAVPAPEVESEAEESKSVEERKSVEEVKSEEEVKPAPEAALIPTPAPVEPEPVVEAQPEPAPEVKAPEPEPLEEEPVIVAKPEPEPAQVPEPEPAVEEPVPKAPTPPPVLTVQTEPAEPIVTLAPPEDTMARRSELSPVPEEPRQLPTPLVETSTSAPIPEASTSTPAPQEPTHTDANVQTDPEVVPSTSGQRQVATPQSRPNRKAEELTGLVWLTSHLMNNISAVLSRVVHLFRPVA